MACHCGNTVATCGVFLWSLIVVRLCGVVVTTKQDRERAKTVDWSARRGQTRRKNRRFWPTPDPPTSSIIRSVLSPPRATWISRVWTWPGFAPRFCPSQAPDRVALDQHAARGHGQGDPALCQSTDPGGRGEIQRGLGESDQVCLGAVRAVSFAPRLSKQRGTCSMRLVRVCFF